MKVLQIQLSDDKLKLIEDLANINKLSIENFISDAISNNIDYFKHYNYFEKRFKDKTKEDFLRVLSQVPDVEPPEYDRL
ncbi:MAG: hypothetical protein KIT33_03785 [Candidatus Kapabacteria bacterium]|nr:hypothetical protein [Ignavibacteriota bacterium]MCW5884074.1 hypothetical protein [Candidatus Kapabacteria bacterium]